MRTCVRAIAFAALSGLAQLSAAQPTSGQLSANPAGVRWGIDTLGYSESGVCTGATFTLLPPPCSSPGCGILGNNVHSLSLLSSSGGSTLGAASFPATVACTSGQYAFSASVYMTYWDRVPPGLSIAYGVRGYGGAVFTTPTTYFNTAPVPINVYFEHTHSVPELGVGVTGVGYGWPCSISRAEYQDPATAPFPPPPGMVSPQYFRVSFQGSSCRGMIVGMTLPVQVQDGEVWMLDGTTWSALRNGVGVNEFNMTVSGNTVIALLPSTIGNTIAFSYVRPGVTPTPSSARVDPVPDLWWAGASESGWGMNISRQGEKLFIAGFVYDAAGKPTWIVMSDGTWDAAHTTWSGQFYQMHGAPFANYNPGALKAGAAGGASLAFTGPEGATLSFTPPGGTMTKSLSRYVFSPDSAPGPYAGLWWGGASQDGWGLSVSQQGDTVFATWYTYDANGEPQWFYMTAARNAAGHYAGPLYRTSGAPWMGVAAYDGSKTHSIAAGTLDLVFKDGQSGTMTATVGSTTIIQAIQRFGS